MTSKVFVKLFRPHIVGFCKQVQTCVLVTLFFCLAVFSPELPKQTSAATPLIQLRVPILYYHHISKNPTSSSNVNINKFAAQIKYIHQNNYHVINFAKLRKALAGETTLPSKPVIIAFDDGLKDQYLNAYPILKKYNKKATFFIPTGLLDRSSKPNPSFMTVQQVRTLSLNRMEIASHTLTHARLTDIVGDPQKINFELLASRNDIERITGKKPDFFAYPYGSYNEEVINYVKNNGYLLAATSSRGTVHRSDKPYELKRVRIDQKTSNLKIFAYYLGG